MKKYALIASALVILIGAPTQAQVQSGVTIDDVTITGTGPWTVTTKGKVTLGTNDTWVGLRVTYHKGNEVIATFVQTFTQPDAGETENYAFFAGVGGEGQWLAVAQLQYRDQNQVLRLKKAEKQFTLPPP